MENRVIRIKELLAQGKTTREIASELRVSLRDIHKVRQQEGLDMGALERQIDAKESELSVLKNEGLQRKQDIAQLDGQIMALREEKKELELEIQHNKAMDLLRMGALEHQIDAKESELSVLKNEGLQRKQDIAQQDGQIMALREEEQELELEIQHNKAMDLLRTVLSVPGNVEKMIEKSKQLKVDAVVLDLEDSVPAEEKSRARMIVRDAIPALTGTSKKIYVRINPWESGLAKDDMEAVIVKGLDGISQPKPSSAKDIAEVDAFIGKLEKERGIPQNHIKILPWIETAKGMLNAYEIASASSRVIAIIFGANDFVLETGMIRSESENDLVYPRTKIVIASRAAGVLAIDTPFNDFKDEVGLIKEAYLARRLGFDGKLVIHPDQVDTVNRIFLPTENDVAHAVKVLDAFQSARLKGFASTSLDGRMIDIPIAQRALKVILSWTASLRLDTKS